MKRKILLIIAIITAISTQAQPFVSYTDTAHYLMNEIEGKKDKYIGKSFSTFLDSLRINPVFSINGDLRKSSYGSEIFLYFNFERTFSKKHFIIISFQNLLSSEVLEPIFYPSLGKFGKIEDIIAVYKPLIVKDVVTKDYYEEPESLPSLLTNTPTQSDAAIKAQQKAINTRINFFRNKPFYVLWEELTVKPKTILGKTITYSDINESATQFFYETADKLSITHFLVVWMEPIPKTTARQYLLNVIRDFRDPREIGIYSNRIIKDIRAVN